MKKCPTHKTDKGLLCPECMMEMAERIKELEEENRLYCNMLKKIKLETNGIWTEPSNTVWAIINKTLEGIKESKTDE